MHSFCINEKIGFTLFNWLDFHRPVDSIPKLFLGFGFAFPPWRQKNEDDFTCLGGNIGWKRAIGSVLKQGGDDGRPGLCNPLCLALDPM